MDLKTKKELNEEDKEYELNLTNNKNINETVELTFEFYDTEEKHYHGIKSLVTKNFYKICNPGNLSDLISRQEELGTIIGVNSSNEINCYGIQTFLNLKFYEKEECIKNIKNYLKKNIDEDYKFYWDQDTTSLFINERVINTPLQLIPVLYEQLIEDKNWILNQKDEPNKEKYDIQFLVYISNCLVIESLQKKEIQYYRLEDEEMKQNLIYYKQIPIDNQNNHQIMIFKYDNLINLIQKIKVNFK